MTSVRPSVRLSVSQSAPYDVVNEFATKLHILCEILKYMILKYTFPASDCVPCDVSSDRDAAYCHMLRGLRVSVFCEV